DIRLPFSAVSFGWSALNSGSDFPDWVTAADVNGDGKLDLITSGAASVTILLGKGANAFQQPQSYSASLPGPIETADINGDGNLDLVFINQNNGNVDLMTGNGSGSFQSVPEVVLSSPGACCVVTGDFNGDGKLDLAIGLLDGQVAVLIGNGN